MTDDTDLEAACAVAEDTFQRGDVDRSRAQVDEVLAAARSRGDRGAEARALQLAGEIAYDDLAYGTALDRLAEAVAIREEILGPDSYLTRYGRGCRAVVLAGEDRHDEADAELARALPASGVPASKEEAAAQARLWVTLGGALHSRDRNVEARRIFEALVAAADGMDELALANVYLHYAGLLEGARESERATALYNRMLAIRRRVIGVPSLRVALGLVGLGTSRLRAGKPAEARAVLEESAAMLEATGHASHPRASVVYLGLAVLDIIAGDGPASERWITRAVALETRTFGGTHPNTASMLLTAAQSFVARGHHGRAAELAQQAATALLPRVRTRHEAFETAVGQAYLSLRHVKRHEAVIRWLEPMVATLDRMTPPPEHSLAPLLNMIGESYLSQGKVGKAEAVVRRSLALTERVHGLESEQMHVVLTNLAQLLTRQKRVAEAREIEQRAARIKDGLEARASSPFASRWRRGLA